MDVLAGEEPSSRLARSLLEALAAHLGMSEGRWQAELVFENGRYREMSRRHVRIPGPAVERGFAGEGP